MDNLSVRITWGSKFADLNRTAQFLGYANSRIKTWEPKAHGSPISIRNLVIRDQKIYLIHGLLMA